MIAALCQFYGLSPVALRDATMEEIGALARWMEESVKARTDG